MLVKRLNMTYISGCLIKKGEGCALDYQDQQAKFKHVQNPLKSGAKYCTHSCFINNLDRHNP